MKSIAEIAGARLPWHLSARLAGWRAGPNALVWQPAPPVKGDPAVARWLASGVLLFEGRLAETQDPEPWDVSAPDEVWAAELHGHGWLDHAAAADDPTVWAHFVPWVWSWLERYGEGQGPGWRPDLVARRLTRWIAHSVPLLNGQSPARSTRFFRALGMQARYVDWRWRDMQPGVPRIEALAGLVYARLSLEGTGPDTDRSITELAREATATITEDGSIASRSPEALARVVSVLAWSLRSIEDAGRAPGPGHAPAIARGLTVLRGLRHPSGALARFHGGRPGLDLPLEDIVRAAGPTLVAPQAAPMGYRRLEQGQGVLIADCAMPPSGPNAATAHISPLAFEFSHGTQPIIVNCGSGLGFGAEAAITARRAMAHSMMTLADACPGVLSGGGDVEEPLLQLNGTVSARQSSDDHGGWLLGETTVFEPRTALRVERRFHLAASGTKIKGEETAVATTAANRARAKRLFADQPCEMRVGFHIHPSITVTRANGGRAVVLKLPDGQIWMFTSDAGVLSIVPSRYFDTTRPRPRATSEIVATSRVLDYWGRITWSLERLPGGASPMEFRAVPPV